MSASASASASPSAAERWLLPMLASMRVRPGMYLGDERIESLSLYLSAYQTAREDAGLVGMHPDDQAMLKSFELRLAEGMPEGGTVEGIPWNVLVIMRDSGPRNIRTFFGLFEGHLQVLGQSLDNVPPWVPSYASRVRDGAI